MNKFVKSRRNFCFNSFSMNSRDATFADAYQKIYVQHTDEPKKTADVLRKCAVLNYSASLDTFDNQSSTHLLTNKLNKLQAIVNNENSNIYNSKLKSLLKGKKIPEKHSSLNKIDVKSLITHLPCSSADVGCSTSELVSEESFNEFRTLFHQKRVKGVLNEPNKFSFSKKFAPQTCNLKASKFTKQISNYSIDNENVIESQRVSEMHPAISKEVKELDKETKAEQYGFKTAREEFNIQSKKYGGCAALGGQKRKLGARRGIGGKFVSPMLSSNDCVEESSKNQDWGDQPVDERLKNLEPKMVELIKSEIMDCGPSIDWNDIAGLDFAKTAIQEAVVWPMLRPDIFTGLRRPPKGILLFGPPGTGKTLIGKCVASQSKSTFFSISASSLTSKWIGDGEKMVRALFTVARCYQPAVIFIDEIDSLLSQRSETEHESSRRIKTEFLVQLDGATTDNDERLLVIGATNRPQELDEAARRRFVKRLYIPLPELEARLQLVQTLMAGEKHNLNDKDMMAIAEATDGYSGADMRNLCSDASLGPIRSIDMNMIQSIQTTEVRPVFMEDFKRALARVKSSVASDDLEQYIKWNKIYGSGNFI